MICQLCKCPYCGCVIGLDKDDHTVVFNSGRAERREPLGNEWREPPERCPHLAYAVWRIETWELDFEQTPRVGFGVNGDWRCAKLIAAVDEHPSAYLEDELSDLVVAGIDESLAAVAPHQIEQGRRTIERLMTAAEKAQEPRGSDREWVVDFVAQLQCVFALNVDRFVNYLAWRSSTDLSWIPQRAAVPVG
jgi:hypothetical protein